MPNTVQGFGFHFPKPDSAIQITADPAVTSNSLMNWRLCYLRHTHALCVWRERKRVRTKKRERERKRCVVIFTKKADGTSSFYACYAVSRRQHNNFYLFHSANKIARVRQTTKNYNHQLHAQKHVSFLSSFAPHCISFRTSVYILVQTDNSIYRIEEQKYKPVIVHFLCTLSIFTWTLQTKLRLLLDFVKNIWMHKSLFHLRRRYRLPQPLR